jgi:hypothetical protein
MNPETFNQDLNRIKAGKTGNARERVGFGCPATPAPTPPVSLCEYRKAVVGAGLLYSRIQVGAGVKKKISIKNKVESQKQSQSQKKHREKPPVVSLKGLAGFFTLFPEGVPFGVFYVLTSIQGGWT